NGNHLLPVGQLSTLLARHSITLQEFCPSSPSAHNMKSLWLSLLLARIGQSPNETEEERLLRLVGVVSLLVGGTFVLLLCGCYWLFDEVLAASIAFLYLIMLLTSGVLWSYGVLGLYQWAWLMRVLALLKPFLSTWLLGGLINSGLVATWGSFALLST